MRWCSLPSGRKCRNGSSAAAPCRIPAIDTSVTTPAQLEARNPNYVAGDIVGGSNTLRGLFARPVLRANPYATGIPGVYLCSASTPPGAGTHGMSGHLAAVRAIRHLVSKG